jgi:hypothetical protein
MLTSEFLNQLGLYTTIFGLPVALYAYLKPRHIHLVAHATRNMSLRPIELPFTITIVNHNVRQANLDRLEFEVRVGPNYLKGQIFGQSYSCGLLGITRSTLTDGDKLSIAVSGEKVSSDLARFMSNHPRTTHCKKISSIKASAYLSTGKCIQVTIDPRLTADLLAQVRNKLYEFNRRKITSRDNT